MITTLPKITNRKFGVEIEFVGADPYVVADTLTNAGIECFFEGYHHRTRPYWKIVTDGSLSRVNGYAGELVSPILEGEEGIENLRKTLEVLNSVDGVTVNRSCGLHIHLNAADLTVQQIAKIYERYADYESQIDLVMPRSRRGWGADYVRSIKQNKSRCQRSRTKRSLSNFQNKYHKVNLCNILTIGTIEFRQHSGTTDFKKIVHWISFLQQFVDASVSLAARRGNTTSTSRPYNNFRTVMENLDLPITWRQGYWVTDRGHRWSNYTLNELYDGNRDRDINLDRVRNLLEAYGVVSRHDEISIVPNAQAAVASSTQVTDNGWLSGVDTKVQQYMAERELDLN